jgi:hypothetical protein
MFKRFASIGHPQEFGYSFDSEAWDSKAPIESHFRVFHNYGDGLTAHSPDWSVQLEQLPDYLASLAQAMLADDELAQNLYYTIWRRPDAKRIAWASTVIYKAPKEGEYGKRRYFSAKEMKVSASPAKEHDKRYEEIRDIHDGSAKSIFRILIPEYADGLEKYATAEAIRDWLMEHDGYMELAAEFLKWFNGDREKARQLRDAYDACRHITESYRLRCATVSARENYKRQITPREPEAPAAEPAAESEVA